jgi:hypothetical protein
MLELVIQTTISERKDGVTFITFRNNEMLMKSIKLNF